MTFFANFGNHEKNLATQTEIAGADSLQGAAEMFRYFAGLEARESREDSRRDWLEDGSRDRSIDVLERAAAVYREIANQVDSDWLDDLADDEIEFAAVRQSIRYDLEIRSWIRRRGLSPRHQLYLELARRAERLASSLRTLDITQDGRDLSSPVFHCMEQWENLASLARVVAVINRRPTRRNPEESR